MITSLINFHSIANEISITSTVSTFHNEYCSVEVCPEGGGVVFNVKKLQSL